MKTKAIPIVLFLFLFSCDVLSGNIKYAVVISANAEWRIVKNHYVSEEYLKSPWGEFFYTSVEVNNRKEKVLFFHEGWGKVAAAGATQYVIDRFDPGVIINLGTCGGFEGKSEILDVILVEKTVIYDIKEAMGDSKEAIDEYSTVIDLSWLPQDDYPSKVKRSLLVSADRDLVPAEISWLSSEFGASAGDWESGSIAYVCARNGKKCLILRGVTDIVSARSGEAYNNLSLFESRTEMVMSRLLGQLPRWLTFIDKGIK